MGDDDTKKTEDQPINIEEVMRKREHLDQIIQKKFRKKAGLLHLLYVIALSRIISTLTYLQ